jgi:hypothetical protein
MYRYILLCFFTFIVFKVTAQQKSGLLHLLRGKVTDSVSGEPIESALILDLKTNKKAATGSKGKFTLEVGYGDTLKISCLGYKPRIVIVSNGSMLVNMQKGVIELSDVVISNGNSLKSYSTLSNLDLNMQPAKSAQDLLRLIPGLFIAQHQGGGKAEQIFFRGFDADHGTDVNISVDGMPVNMVSHAHGQGYADLHFLIPETVEGYDFGKGPYYTDKGDLTTAGYVAYSTKDELDEDLITVEAGQFQTLRLLAMVNLLGPKAKKNGQTAYIASERLYSNGGPFTLPEHFSRYNIFGKYIDKIDTSNILTVIASTFKSDWRASGEIPDRAVAEGYIANRFGILDSAQGGHTARTNINIKLSSQLGNGWSLDNQLWYSHYYFNLVTNFTFYYYFPETGDEFRQMERRDLGGYSGRIFKTVTSGQATFTTAAGIGSRYDHIYPLELDHTEDGSFLGYLQYGTANELNVNAYADETLTIGNWLFNGGLRLDYFHFYYQNLAPDSDIFATANFAGKSPDAHSATVSPKFNVSYSFNNDLQLYLKAGKGFHSNDARVVIANQGYGILPSAYGADLGINWKPLPKLFINAALWYLYLQQEFTFGQDLIDQPGGPVTPTGKTVRTGLDLSARYQLTDWLFASLNGNLAHPRYIDSAKGHNYVPLAPTFTSTAGLFFRAKDGLNGGISYRYLHDRPADSGDEFTARGYFITDLAVNYTRKRYEVGLAIENLFNRQWDESQFEYTSQLKGETAPVTQVSYTPGVPFFAKLKVALFF